MNTYLSLDTKIHNSFTSAFISFFCVFISPTPTQNVVI